MGLSRHVVQYAKGRVVRRMMRSMPFLGSIVAVATLGAAMRRKGVVGGAVDSTLDALPFVGLLKNTVEAVRGRDFVRDKAVARRR